MTKIGKSSWGPGEWQQEADRIEWRDEKTGLDCLMVRHSSGGHWCGYVAVPPGHQYHGKDYDDVDVRVHGGLTYSNECSGDICHVPREGEPDNVWWLGFDCAHCDDFSPGFSASTMFRRSVAMYRNAEYVKNECKELARQLSQKLSA